MKNRFLISLLNKPLLRGPGHSRSNGYLQSFSILNTGMHQSQKSVDEQAFPHGFPGITRSKMSVLQKLWRPLVSRSPVMLAKSQISGVFMPNSSCWRSFSIWRIERNP